MGIEITVNEKVESTDAAADTPLLYVLRDDLELRGPKFGCGLSQCGACSVLLDGKEIRSCVTPVAAVVGKRVTTLEGLPALYAKQKKLAKRAGAAPVAAGVDRRAGSAVRLLPERNDHHGRRAPVAERRGRPTRRSRSRWTPISVAAPPTTRSCGQSSVPPKRRPEPVGSRNMTSFEQEKFTRSALPERWRRPDRRDRSSCRGRLAGGSAGDGRDAPHDVAGRRSTRRRSIRGSRSTPTDGHSVHWQDGSRPGQPDGALADRRRGARRARSANVRMIMGDTDALGRPGPDGRAA